MPGCFIVRTRKNTPLPAELTQASNRKSGRKRSLPLLAMTAALFAGMLAQSARAQYQFRYFDAPDATLTFARGINNRGQVVGTYTDTNFNTGGFVFDGQNFTLVNVPDAFSTELNDINDAGETVGIYVGDDFSHHSFQANSAGRVEVAFLGALTTEVTGINNQGQITGHYSEVGGSQTHGFLFNGTDFTSFDAPNGQPNVFGGGINDAGVAVGTFFDTSFHGFHLDNGALTTLDLQGATDTFISDINNRGDMVGFYESAVGGQREGFVMRNGRWTPLSIPGASFINLMGINDSGTIVGYFGDGSDQVHGFTAALVPEPTLGLWLIVAGLSGGAGLRQARTRPRRGRREL